VGYSVQDDSNYGSILKYVRVETVICALGLLYPSYLLVLCSAWVCIPIACGMVKLHVFFLDLKWAYIAGVRQSSFAAYY